MQKRSVVLSRNANKNELINIKKENENGRNKK